MMQVQVMVRICVLSVFTVLCCGHAKPPKLSLIAPVLNAGEGWLIKDLMRDLSRYEICKDIEVIVIESGTLIGPRAYEVLKKAGVAVRYGTVDRSAERYLTINKGIDLAQGDYIALLRAGEPKDWGAMRLFINTLDENPDIDLVYGDYISSDEPQKTFALSLDKIVDVAVFAPHRMMYCLPGPHAVWRTSLHYDYGYFDEDYVHAADLEFWNRVVSRGAQFKKLSIAAGIYCKKFDYSRAEENQPLVKKENEHIAQKYSSLWDVPFVIVIPSYNNAEWYERNLNSVFSQKYQNYRVIYIDDQSPDGTGDLVEDYTAQKNQEHRVTLIKNSERKKALSNIYDAVHSCKQHEVIIILDGDDALAHDGVLSHLNKIYQDPNVWLTYGQFKHWPTNAPGWAKQLPQEVVKKNDFRSFHFWSTHLRTFYAGLFQNIKKDDLMHNGQFFQAATDVVTMMALLEMAGMHSRFVPEVQYLYNIANQINEHKVDRSFQWNMNLAARKKARYRRLLNPFERVDDVHLEDSSFEKLTYDNQLPGTFKYLEGKIEG